MAHIVTKHSLNFDLYSVKWLALQIGILECLCVRVVCLRTSFLGRFESNLNINTDEKSHFQFSFESTKFENHQTTLICTSFAKRVHVSAFIDTVLMCECEWQISELGVKH